MARAAQNKQVFLGIISQATASNQMMDLQVGSTAALLALPSVTPQDPLEQFLVRGAFQFHSGALWRRISHS